jgi:hypothetical protein
MMTLINRCTFRFSPPRVALDVSSDGMCEPQAKEEMKQRFAFGGSSGVGQTSVRICVDV